MGGGERDGLPTLLRVNDIFSARKLPRPPVAILTGDTDTSVREAFLRAGASIVILKPCSLKTLRHLKAIGERARVAIATTAAPPDNRM